MSTPQVVDSDYLQACKHSNATTRTPKWQRVRREKRSSEINEDNKNDNNEIVLIEDPSGLKFFPLPKRHYKLLQFHENHRPAYYGTWSRRSKVLTPRNPFKKDNVRQPLLNLYAYMYILMTSICSFSFQ